MTHVLQNFCRKKWDFFVKLLLLYFVGLCLNLSLRIVILSRWFLSKPLPWQCKTESREQSNVPLEQFRRQTEGDDPACRDINHYC
ncbi:hypothetical protein RRG08_006954 [Elysia crispata]|uniref:Uncharacterized protein n=1 Tax=Elysia crispata TaxID=231223 RepID=A0AAE0XR75_9GAST|nr:hypothetical protein RRG08_006954 [Elysia crispata]